MSRKANILRRKISSPAEIEQCTSEEDGCQELISFQSPPQDICIVIDEPIILKDSSDNSIYIVPDPEIEDDEFDEDNEDDYYAPVVPPKNKIQSPPTLVEKRVAAVQTNVSIPLYPTATRHVQVQVQVRKKDHEAILKLRKRFFDLKKKSRMQEKLFKKMKEVKAIHDFKSSVEASYKLLLESQKTKSTIERNESKTDNLEELQPTTSTIERSESTNDILEEFFQPTTSTMEISEITNDQLEETGYSQVPKFVMSDLISDKQNANES